MQKIEKLKKMATKHKTTKVMHKGEAELPIITHWDILEPQTDAQELKRDKDPLNLTQVHAKQPQTGT